MYVITWQARGILTGAGLKKLCIWVGSADEEQSAAAANLLKTIMNTITGLEAIKHERDKFELARKTDPGSKLKPFTFVFDRIGQCTHVK